MSEVNIYKCREIIHNLDSNWDYRTKIGGTELISDFTEGLAQMLAEHIPRQGIHDPRLVTKLVDASNGEMVGGETYVDCRRSENGGRLRQVSVVSPDELAEVGFHYLNFSRTTNRLDNGFRLDCSRLG
tara:strand:+ start:396 stop:779 length:384 start_codon:yes stop_codon:yes gene_type:complete